MLLEPTLPILSVPYVPVHIQAKPILQVLRLPALQDTRKYICFLRKTITILAFFTLKIENIMERW